MSSSDTNRPCCTGREPLAVVCCCGPSPKGTQEPVHSPNVEWITGRVSFAASQVPTIRTDLSWADQWGAWKARWAIRRMNYRVPPGLYAVDRDACMECGAVARNCEREAITVRAGVGCLEAVVRGALTGSAPTCDCAGESSCCG